MQSPSLTENGSVDGSNQPVDSSAGGRFAALNSPITFPLRFLPSLSLLATRPSPACFARLKLLARPKIALPCGNWWQIGDGRRTARKEIAGRKARRRVSAVSKKEVPLTTACVHVVDISHANNSYDQVCKLHPAMFCLETVHSSLRRDVSAKANPQGSSRKF